MCEPVIYSPFSKDTCMLCGCPSLVDDLCPDCLTRVYDGQDTVFMTVDESWAFMVHFPNDRKASVTRSGFPTCPAAWAGLNGWLDEYALKTHGYQNG